MTCLPAFQYVFGDRCMKEVRNRYGADVDVVPLEKVAVVGHHFRDFVLFAKLSSLFLLPPWRALRLPDHRLPEQTAR